MSRATVFENVKDLKTLLKLINMYRKVLIGGEGCYECEALYAMAESCIDAYIKLSHDVEDELIEYLFNTGVWGIPFIAINGKIIYDPSLDNLKTLLCLQQT